MVIELHSAEAVIITKKKDEGKCKLTGFHVDSTSCFIMRNNLGL